MNKKIFNLFLRTLLMIVTISYLSSCGGQKTETGKVEWPEITKETKPWTRWWWPGNAVNEKDLTVLLETYQKAWLGGVEVTGLYGVRGTEDQFINFVSPEWMDKFVYTLGEAKRLDLGVDLANASAWPFGGPWIDEDNACKYVTSKIFKVQGGQKLTEPIEYIQEPYINFAGSKRGTIDEIKYPVTANENLQEWAFDNIRYPIPLPLIVITASKAGGNGFLETIDLTNQVVNGKLDWTAPEGEWTVCALFLGDHGKMVKRPSPGAEGNVIDHFSAKSLKTYLDKFDESFKGYDISYLRHFYNDSYEVDNGSPGESNWTPEFLAEFKSLHGYDLKNHLPALLELDTEEMNRRVLYDYRMTIDYLILERYTKNWQKWAAAQGKGIRNQAHGSPGNILDLYAASDVPEIEGAMSGQVGSVINLKSAPSAAHVTGKRLTASESATWLGEHFVSTLGEVRNCIDKFLLAGVNHICYHGTTYSPQEAAWPGWLFYASVQFNPTNSWWDDFGAFNRYVARSQSFLQAGKPSNDFLVYFAVADLFSGPIPDRSAALTGSPGSVSGGGSSEGQYAGPTRRMLQKMSHGNVFSQVSMGECAEYLDKEGYSWDAISDRQLMDVSFEKPFLRTGGNNYKTIVVPAMHYIPIETFERLIDLANNGATILFYKYLPSDIPGLANLEQDQKTLNSLKINLSFTENGNLRTANCGKGKIIISDNLSGLVAVSGVTPESMYAAGLQCIRRIKDDGNFYYFIKNPSENGDFEGWIELNVKYNSAAIYNPMTGADGYAKTRTNNGKTEIFVQMKPQESIAIETFRGKYSGNMYPYYQISGEPITLSDNWNIEFVKGGPTLPEKRLTSKLESWTNYGGEYNAFSGTADYTVTIPTLSLTPDAWRLNLENVNESATVYVNGKYIGTLLNSPFTIEIPSSMLHGGDELKISVSNLMANRIADMDKKGIEWKIFYNNNIPARIRDNIGADGKFSAKNWDPKDSGLSGLVTLTPLIEIE